MSVASVASELSVLVLLRVPTVRAALLQRGPAQPGLELAVAVVVDVVVGQDGRQLVPVDVVDAAAGRPADDLLADGRLLVQPAPVVGLLADADHAHPVGAVADQDDHPVDAVVGLLADADHGLHLHYVVGLLADADHGLHHLDAHRDPHGRCVRRHHGDGRCVQRHHAAGTTVAGRLPAAARRVRGVWSAEYRPCKSTL